MRYVLATMRWDRRQLRALGALSLPLLLAACGSTGAPPAAAPPAYPPAHGARVDAGVLATLTAMVDPPGVPAWATPPLDGAAARVVVRQRTREAVVLPYRSGQGWCLGYVQDGSGRDGWCTPRSGSHQAVEAGLMPFTRTHIGIVARASSAVARLVVTLADGRRVPVALRHGAAIAVLSTTALAGNRPVTVSAIGRDGGTIARRPLGWSASSWRALTHPDAFVKPTRAELVRLQSRAPCLGLRHQSGVSSATEIWSSRPSALLAAFIPVGSSPQGGELYVTTPKPVHVTLIDAGGARRPLALGAGRCAYVPLSARERRAPFRLEARNAAGRVVDVEHPSDWYGFPTDGD